MKYKLGLFVLLIIFASCSNNNKTGNSHMDTVSIHKLWKYDTVRTTSKTPGLIGRNLLDLTNKDSLRFSYQSIKATSTTYTYNILHDTIFVNKSAAYKIIKLTSDELDLYAIFKHDNAKAEKDSVIMIYKTN